MGTSIKIIKRRQRELWTEAEPVEGSKTDNQLRREIAKTVTSWIEERKDVGSLKEYPQITQIKSLVS